MSFRIGDETRTTSIEHDLGGGQVLHANFRSQESVELQKDITKYRKELAAITATNIQTRLEQSRKISERYFNKNCLTVEGYEVKVKEDWVDLTSQRPDDWKDFVPREHKHGYWTSYVATDYENVGNV